MYVCHLDLVEIYRQYCKREAVERGLKQYSRALEVRGQLDMYSRRAVRVIENLQEREAGREWDSMLLARCGMQTLSMIWRLIRVGRAIRQQASIVYARRAGGQGN